MDLETHLEQANRETQRFLSRSLRKLRKYWWLVSASVLFSLVVAFLVIRYSSRVYSIGAKLLIETSSEGIDTRSFLFDNQLFASDQDLLNELIIIESYPVLSQTVRDLDQNIRYFRTTKALERVIEIESEESPFRVEIDGDWVETQALLGGAQIIVKPELDGVKLLTEDGEEIASGAFGEVISMDERRFRVVKNPSLVQFESKLEYMFAISSVESTVLEYQSRLSVELSLERSTIIDLKILAKLTGKEIRFLDKLISNYLDANLGEKNQGASNTIDFINRELRVITDSLKRIEGRLQAFKSRKQISNLQQEGQRIFERLLEMEEENAELMLRKKYLQLVDEYLNDDELGKLVSPTSFGIQDPGLSALTSQLLQLESERSMFGQDSESEIARQLDLKIKELRQALTNYVKNVKNTNDIQLKQVQSRMKLVESAIEDLPVSEIALMNIERLHKLSESLYLLLLEKKTEAEITKSSNTPDIKIVERPRMLDGSPVKPNKRLMYLGLFALGATLPLLWILVTVWLDRTIHTKDEISEVLEIPFMGYVPSAIGRNKDYILEAPKSRLAEAFRTLRSNIKYLSSRGAGKVILITSCFPGEGKTFVSSNLSLSAASSGIKTILIGGDLRKPQLHNQFDIPNEHGLSSFLAGRVELSEVIQTYKGGLDIITSGPIPPNPLELLDSERFDKMIEKLRSEYKMVIIDTSPFILVSDAKVLFDQADLNLIVLRSRFSKIQNLRLIKDLVKGYTTERFSVLLNDQEMLDGYGYSYRNSYGYYQDADLEDYA